jgi:hypothetical protein
MRGHTTSGTRGSAARNLAGHEGGGAGSDPGVGAANAAVARWLHEVANARLHAEVSTRAMQAFLDRLAATLAEDEHVLLVLDRAGWHGANALVVPGSITLAAAAALARTQPRRAALALPQGALPLPPPARGAVVDAACAAWRRVTSEPGRVASLCSYPWIVERVSS